MKTGHIALIIHIINSLDAVEGGVNKEDARIIVALKETLGTAQVSLANLEEEFKTSTPLTGGQTIWILNKINRLFEATKMPVLLSGYALEMLDEVPK